MKKNHLVSPMGKKRFSLKKIKDFGKIMLAKTASHICYVICYMFRLFGLLSIKMKCNNFSHRYSAKRKGSDGGIIHILHNRDLLMTGSAVLSVQFEHHQKTATCLYILLHCCIFTSLSALGYALNADLFVTITCKCFVNLV